MTRAFALVCLCVLVSAGTAFAKPRIAMVPFDGDNGSQVSDTLAELLEADYAVTGTKQVGRTIDKLGIDAEKMSDKDLKKLANELEADAIVRGDVSQSGKRKLLHVKLYLNGKRARGFKAEFANVKSPKVKQALKDKIVAKLNGEDRAPKKKDAEVEAADEEDPADKKKKKKGDEVAKKDEEEALATKKDKADETKGDAEADSADKGAEDKGDDDKDKGDEEDGDKKAKKRTAAVDDEDIGGVEDSVTVVGRENPHTANRAAIRVDFGGSVSSRLLEFSSRNFEQAPNPYSNAPVPGYRVGGAIYPLAFTNPDGIASGLGIGGHYDQTAKLDLQSTVQPGTKFPVLQKHWSIGGRFRFVFGKKATRPSVTIGGGYFHRMFKVDRSQLMEGNFIDVPDVFYKGFDPGLEIRIPVSKLVAILLAGNAVLVTSAGQITQGQNYGQAKVTGGDVTIGVDIVPIRFVAVKIALEGTQLGYKFAGNGEMANNRDGNPSTPDVGGAVDRYLGGSLTLAVLY
jgi:hypothetical protein